MKHEVALNIGTTCQCHRMGKHNESVHMFICKEMLYIFKYFGDYSFCNNALTCVNCLMTNAVMSMYHFKCKWLP